MCTYAWVLIMRLCFLFQVCCNLQSCQCVELAVAESVSSPEPVSVAIRHFWNLSTPLINCCDKTDRSDFLHSFQNGSLILFQMWEKRDDPRRRTLSIEPRLRGHPFIVGFTLYWVIQVGFPNHTWYLSFFLHWQNFWRIKFTPKKKRVNYDKIHSKLPIFCIITAKYTVNCQFFALNL